MTPTLSKKYSPFMSKMPKRRFIIIVYAVLLCVGSARADVRMPGDPLVEAVRGAYSRAGRVQPFTSFPVTEDEIRRAVDALSRDSSVSEEDLALLEGMFPASEGDRIEVKLDLSYRGYLRTSEEYIEEACAFENGIDLYRLYLSEPPPVRLSLGWQGENGFFLRAEQALRRELDVSDYFKADNFWQLGDPDNPVGIENHDMVRGILGWARDGWRLTFGRDRIHLGPETFSTLLVSDRIPYLDSVRVSMPFGPFRMDWYIATIPPFRLSTDGDLADPNPYGYYREDDQTIIVDALHRFEWRGRAVRVALAGNVTYVRPNNYFEISDFFPVLSWHSNDVVPNNLRLVLEGSWCFLPGWTVSAQAGYDDISAQTFGVGDTGVPTVDAYILALRRDGGTVEKPWIAILEGGYTHFLWGSFDETATGHGTSSGTLARAIYRLRVDWGAQALPLTSPYGPGSLWLRGSFDLPNPAPSLSLRAEGLFLSKNRLADLVNTPYTYDAAVAEAPRTIYGEVSLMARYVWRAFTLTLTPILAVRDGEFWAEAAIGGNFRLHRTFVVQTNR